MTLWSWVGLTVGIFCIVRGAVDLRQRKHAWGALGILAGLTFILLTPIQTHAVKLDLIVPSNR